MAFAIWLTTTTLSVSKHAKFSPLTSLLSLSTGLSWGFVSLFRPNPLPILLAVLFILVLYSIWRTNHRRLPGVAACILLGTIIVLTPAAHRLQICPVSSNFAMNIALGQAINHRGLIFTDDTWSPPTLWGRGYHTK